MSCDYGRVYEDSEHDLLVAESRVTSSSSKKGKFSTCNQCQCRSCSDSFLIRNATAIEVAINKVEEIDVVGSHNHSIIDVAVDDDVEVGKIIRRNLFRFRFRLPKSVILVFAVIFCVSCMLMQTMTLPLAEASLGGNSGVYFVVFFESALFNVIFWPAVAFSLCFGKVSKQMLAYCFRRHFLFILTGFFDALNGIMICASVSLSRTSGPLQNVLMQSSLPMTMVCSRFLLGKRYSKIHLIGVLFTLFGLVVGLVPTFVEGGFGASAVFWPCVLLVGILFGSLMGVTMNRIADEFDGFSYVLLLAFESLYQILFVSLLFWTDFIPGFGTSSSMHHWWSNFSGGFSCVFVPGSCGEKSDFSLLLCVLFAFGYCCSYYFQQMLISLRSINFATLIGLLASPLASCVWFLLIPSGIPDWAGQPPMASLTVICGICSLPFLILGAFVYARDGELTARTRPLR